MIRYIFLALLCILQVQHMAGLICGSFWKRSDSPRHRRLVYCGLALLNLLGILPPMMEWTVSCAFACAFLVSFLYQLRWYWRICYMALFLLTLGAVELAFGIGSALAWGMSFTEVGEFLRPGTLQFQAGQNLVVFFASFLFRLFRHFWRRTAPSDNPQPSLLSLALPAGSCVIVCFFSLTLPTVSDPGLIAMVMLVYLLLFLANVFLIDLLKRFGRAEAQRQERESARAELRREVEYYRHMIRRQRETSLDMRDIRNQLTVGMSLLREGKTEEAGAVLEHIAAGDRFKSRKRYTGNSAVDAVIQSKERRIKEGGIIFTQNISMPQGCAVASEDLAIVVGNIIDNAIRACEELPPAETRRIHFVVRQFQEYLCFKMENSAAPKAGQPQPQAEAYPTHGFGLQNVRRVAEKYSGNLKAQREENGFSVTILLHNSEGRQPA